jgi:hypothetical protein
MSSHLALAVVAFVAALKRIPDSSRTLRMSEKCNSSSRPYLISSSALARSAGIVAHRQIAT